MKIELNLSLFLKIFPFFLNNPFRPSLPFKLHFSILQSTSLTQITCKIIRQKKSNLFSNLPRPHLNIGKHIIRFNFLREYLHKNSLESQNQFRFFQVLFKHLHLSTHLFFILFSLSSFTLVYSSSFLFSSYLTNS